MNRIYPWLYSLILLCLITCSSCTTLLNKRTQTLRLTTPGHEARITVQDSTYASPAYVTVARSKKPLQIVVADDSVQKTISILPKVDSKILMDLAWLHMALIPVAVDLTNPNRFSYGSRYRLDPYDSVYVIKAIAKNRRAGRPKRQFLNEQGHWGFVLAIPYLNMYSFTPDNEWRGHGYGFWGLSGGMEYMDRDNRSFRLMVSAMADMALPLPIPVDRWNGYSTYESFSVSLTRQMYLKRFIAGYGLTVARHNYTYTYPWWSLWPDVTMNSLNGGLDLYGGYRLSEFTMVGLRYQPTVYKFSDGGRKINEHTLSVEIMFRSF